MRASYNCFAGWLSLDSADGLCPCDEKCIISIAVSVLSPYEH